MRIQGSPHLKDPISRQPWGGLPQAAIDNVGLCPALIPSEPSSSSLGHLQHVCSAASFCVQTCDTSFPSYHSSTSFAIKVFIQHDQFPCRTEPDPADYLWQDRALSPSTHTSPRMPALLEYIEPDSLHAQDGLDGSPRQAPYYAKHHGAMCGAYYGLLRPGRGR